MRHCIPARCPLGIRLGAAAVGSAERDGRRGGLGPCADAAAAPLAAEQRPLLAAGRGAGQPSWPPKPSVEGKALPCV